MALLEEPEKSEKIRIKENNSISIKDLKNDAQELNKHLETLQVEKDAIFIVQIK